MEQSWHLKAQTLIRSGLEYNPVIREKNPARFLELFFDALDLNRSIWLATPDWGEMRLRELGFVAGEGVEVVAAGPLGAEPLLVQVGFTRFALRRAEAARVRLRASGSAA